MTPERPATVTPRSATPRSLTPRTLLASIPTPIVVASFLVLEGFRSTADGVSWKDTPVKSESKSDSSRGKLGDSVLKGSVREETVEKLWSPPHPHSPTYTWADSQVEVADRLYYDFGRTTRRMGPRRDACSGQSPPTK